MKIEGYFQRQQTKPATDKPVSKQEAAERSKSKQGAADGVKDTTPNNERDVDKAGGSGGPLSECTNKQGGGVSASKKQQQQDVQPIGICDDDEDYSNSPAAVPAGKDAAKLKAGEQQMTGMQLLEQQQQQEQPHQEQQEEAMDVDNPLLAASDPVPHDGAAAALTAAAAAAGGEGAPAPAAAAAEQEPATPAGALLKQASNPAGTSMKSTGGKAAADVHLTAEERKQLLDACLEEMPLLEAELSVRPDLSSHLGGEKKPLELKDKVSLLAEGQNLPLTELSELISKTLSGNSSSSGGQGKQAATAAPAGDSHGEAAGASGSAEGSQEAPAATAAAAAAAAGGSIGAGPSALVVRNLIQEVASRKSYGLQDGALANVDALEDATPAFHWCWELRSLTGLPKAVRQHADAARKHRKKVLERLKAASAYVQLAQSFTKPTKAVESKLARAAAKLSKCATLEVLQNQLQAATEAAEQLCSTVKGKQAVSRLDKANKEEQAALAKALKTRQAEEEKASKEAERAAKEAAKAAEAAEKARIKAEKDAEREAKRQQKAAEAAKKAAEAEKKAAEAAKRKEASEAAKAGFGSTTQLHKAQNVFKSFFGLPAQRPPTPSGGDTSQGQGSQMEGGSHKDSGKEATRLWALASGPTQKQLCEQELLEQQLPYFPAAGGGTSTAAGDMVGLLAASRQHWRALRRQHKRVWGLPPSWARRPGVADDPDHVQRAAAALYGDGVDIHRLRCWRRKLIKHQDSVRPPFYGSIPRTHSAAVRGRQPFGKAVELDYEEMSDQDWEEEPEGESLSADEEGEEEGVEEGDEDEEGFVVGDGYLSDDEGMREMDDDGVSGGGGSQQLLGGAAAAAAAAAGGVSTVPGACSSDSSSSSALAHLEAVLDHARSRGRHVVLVNNCPEMQWEPTTQLPPSILSCLRGTLMRTDITAAPPTPADLTHILGSSALHAAAAAATAVAAAGAVLSPTAGATGGSSPDGAGGAGGETCERNGGGGANGGRGRPPSIFPEGLLPALVELVHNSKLTMDQLVKQFVEQQAAVGVKVAKARVKDKIKEISTMRKVSKSVLYTVKQEVLQAVGQGPQQQQQQEQQQQQGGDAAAAEGAAGPDDMQIDGDDVGGVDVGAAGALPAEPQQPAAAATEPVGAEPAAAAPATGTKRPAAAAAAADAVPQQQQVGSGQVDPAAASCPPTKKHKQTPACASITRWFSSTTPANKQQQPHGTEAPQQQQQQQQHGTPPSTPKHKLPGVPSLHLSELQGPAGAAGGSGDMDAAATAAGGPGATAAGGRAGVDRSGALPMLTPPSDAAAEDRPSKGRHSPVPFRLNSLNAAAHDTAAAAGAEGAAGAEQQQQQQQQAPPARQNIAHMFRRQQQQQQQQQRQEQPAAAGGGGEGQPGSSQGGLLGGSAAHVPAAAVSAGDAAGGHKPSRLGGAGAVGVGGSSSSRVGPPQLPDDSSTPSSSFWKQLAQWVVGVKQPSAADIEAAFRVFDEQHLGTAIRTMPQIMLSAMVKTLGSNTQSFPMRSACARCISNAVSSLVQHEQQQQQQKDHTHSAAAAAPASSPSPQQQQQRPQTTPAASHDGCTPSPSRRDLLGVAAAAASPSPSGSPRSAPVGASFEELCAEPGLLQNLLLCLNPTRALDAARAARAAAGSSSSSSGLGPDAVEDAELLAKNAARAVSRMLLVGLVMPPAAGKVSSLHDCSIVTAAAAAQLRLRVASVNNWRGSLRSTIRTSEDDMHRTCFALMATWALLKDPAACSQLIANKRLASGLLGVVAGRGSRDRKWAVQKWCLLVLSALLSDATFREWALPWGSALQPLQPGTDETCEALEGLAALLTSATNRPKQGLGDPDSADRAVLGHCLQLCSLLVDFLHAQQQQQTTSLPRRLAQLFDGGAAQEQEEAAGNQAGGCCLRQALQGVAEQTDWPEAAQQALQLLHGGSGSQQQQQQQEQQVCDAEMQD